MQRNFIRHYW